MEDLKKTSQIPSEGSDAKKLENALNSQMKKYGIAIIPCKKAEDGSKKEGLLEKEGRKDVETSEKKGARRKLSANWMLGFLGFMGIRGIVGVLKGNYLEAFWLVWFVWFIYFVPRKK